MHLILIYSLAYQGNQTDSVSDEFIVKYRCVLLHLDEVNGHSWYLTYDDPTEGVGNWKLCVTQLKLQDISAAFKDRDFYFVRVDSVLHHWLITVPLLAHSTTKHVASCSGSSVLHANPTMEASHKVKLVATRIVVRSCSSLAIVVATEVALPIIAHLCVLKL